MRCLNFFVCGSSRSETVESERSKASKTFPVLQRRGSSVSSTPHSSFSWPSTVTSFDSSTSSLPPPPPTSPSQIPSNQITTSALISLRTTDPGVCLSLLGKDTLLCTSSHDQTLKVLNSTDLSTISTLANAKSPVKTLLVSGTKIFTAHQDLKIRVWELLDRERNKLRAVLPTLHDRLITSMLPNSHVQTRRHRTELRIQHFDSISALALGAAGTLLYSASWDKSIKVWSLSTYRCIESFKAHEDAVNSLAATTDGFLYSASTDGAVKAWERAAAGGENSNKHLLTATFQRHASGVNALALSSDELFLYSASSDRSVIVWEREDSADHMSVSQVLKGHTHAVLCLGTAGHVLCSGSADKTIRVWRRQSGGGGKGKLHWCIGVLETQAGPVRSVATSEGLNVCRVYGASVDGSVKAWLVSVGSILAGTVEQYED